MSFSQQQILTFYSSGHESGPGYWEAIVVKLQLLHQRNIILYKTQTMKWNFTFGRSVFSTCFTSHLITPPWLCNSPHKTNPQFHFVGFCLSCERTHPRCSVLFHLCPRLLLFDRLNCRHPTKILINTTSVTGIQLYSDFNDQLWRVITSPLTGN